MLFQCRFLILLFGFYTAAQIPCETSSTECCLTSNGDPEYSCHGALVILLPQKSIQIDCKEAVKQTYWDTANLPSLDLGNKTSLAFTSCPFPTNISKILDNLRIKTVENLTINYAQKFGSINLTSDYFQGLGGLKRLCLKKNNFKVIQKNTFSKLKDLESIDLQQNNLKLLTDYIFQDTDKLKKIDLSRNEIHNLSENAFQDVTNLMYLILRKNKLVNINDEIIRNLKSLVILDLGYNSIIKLTENSLSDLKNLTDLVLERNKFKSFPKNIFKENLNLKFVNMNRNSLLSTLPDSLFANLKNLNEVLLENCNLTVLPKNLFDGCGNLQNIALKKNNIQSLTETIFYDLENLHRLDLSFNKLTNLSGTLFRFLTNLKVLDLRNNGLVKLDKPIFNELSSLEEINLQNNLLQRFDFTLFPKSMILKKIILSNNNISISKYDIIPFNILEGLEKLDLSENGIKWFSKDWIIGRTSLKELNLSHNQINRIDYEDIAESLNVTIDLTHNNISVVNFSMAESLAKTIANSSQIVINLNNNPVDCSCHLYDLIRYFDGSMNSLVKTKVKIQADNLSCTSPNNLIGVSLKNLKPEMVKCTFDQLKMEPCSDICDCYFRPWDKALLITCENRSLIRVPKLILPTTNNYNQTHVKLTNNLLKSGPAKGMGYENVTKMILSSNNINKLTWMPPQLKILSLYNNSINRIDYNMLNMLNSSRLTDITLGKNPYICDCSNENLYKFLVGVLRNKNIDVSDIKCKNGGNNLVELTTNDLCPPSRMAMYIGYGIAAILVLIIFIFSVYFYFYKNKILKWIDENTPSWFPKLQYDAFICYSHKDEDFVIKELISVLEKGENPYKLCVHIRDWTPGKFIIEQIIDSVETSRRTIIVLSLNFLESVWGLVEFKTAHSRAMMQHNAKVIVILYGDIDENAHLDDVLKTYIRTNTYIKWGDTHFWSKLRRALDNSKSYKEMEQSQKNQNIALTAEDNLVLGDAAVKK